MHPFNNHTDEALVGLLKTGNDKAFECLYDRYWQRMIIKAYALLGSEADAEEVVQNTFVNLWQRRHHLELKFTFHTYLAAAVKYEVLAFITKRKKQALTTLSEMADIGPADHSLQHLLDFQDLQAELETAVLALPEKCQLVFRLSREEKMSEREIAETLVISRKTVQAHMTKALRTLRISLRYYFFSLFIF